MPDSRSNDTSSHEYARQLFDRSRDLLDERMAAMREYVDERFDRLIEKIDRHNKHRMTGIETVGKTAAACEADLMQGEHKPGWVHVRVSRLEKTTEANAEVLKWQNRLLILTLIGLCANLAVAVMR